MQKRKQTFINYYLLGIYYYQLTIYNLQTIIVAYIF